MTARHSYELLVLEESSGGSINGFPASSSSMGKPTPFLGDWARAEGHNLDAALRDARRIVEASGRIIRSGPSVSEQHRTRARGPQTGKIIIVVHRAERSRTDRTMTESRLKRGLPKEIAK